MNALEINDLIDKLKPIYDIVRLVDADTMCVCEIEPDGNVIRHDYNCFAVWKKKERCVNCISAKACSGCGRLEKFEFIEDQVFHVLSKCVYVEDKKYVLELVTKTTDDTLFEAYGKGRFIKAISDINNKMYVDSLTGVMNRRYYDEQKARLDRSEAIALIDIDNFKQVNDIYGHIVGDEMLKEIGMTIKKSVRKTDTVIRYGGDEFCIFFQSMQVENLEDKLNDIRNRVKEISLPDIPEIMISISIGGHWNGEFISDPIRIVDEKLYKAKKNKDCVVI